MRMCYNKIWCVRGKWHPKARRLWFFNSRPHIPGTHTTPHCSPSEDMQLIMWYYSLFDCITHCLQLMSFKEMPTLPPVTPLTPLTVSIRLTAALILRNLALFSSYVKQYVLMIWIDCIYNCLIVSELSWVSNPIYVSSQCVMEGTNRVRLPSVWLWSLIKRLLKTHIKWTSAESHQMTDELYLIIVTIVESIRSCVNLHHYITFIIIVI